MIKYILNRVIWTIPVLLLAIFLTFMLIRAMPGNPFVKGPSSILNPAIVKAFEHRYGTDKPWYVQYSDYVGNLAQGDMGISWTYVDRSVSGIIKDQLPNSAELGGFAFLFAMFVGTGVGVISALHHNRIADHALTLVSTLFFAIPSFVTATYWVYYIPHYSGWNPPSQRIGPIVVLGLSLVPYFARLVRGSMLETLQADFVTTARAKGLPWRRTVVRHVLRNSLIPMVTNSAPLLGFVMTGAFIVELIFTVPGIANEYVSSVQQKDYSVMLGLTVLLVMLIVVLNLVADIILGFLDPRISHD